MLASLTFLSVKSMSFVSKVKISDAIKSALVCLSKKQEFCIL